MSPILSLCIPTNGILEWVIPVLDSIYLADADEDLYELVIEDNGNNALFVEIIREYQKNHQNLQYYKSSSSGFLCQIDCFMHASGRFIKFVNHRFLFEKGSVEYLLDFIETHEKDRPVTFFSNGNLKNSVTNSFDEFIRDLSYWSSWSGGLSFWREDLELITDEMKYNELFPHTDLLFARRNAEKYLVINRKLFTEIDAGHGKKGSYNLFWAFAVEYPSILGDLLREQDISIETFLQVKEELLNFLADQYIGFILQKKENSYNFENYQKYLSVFYSLSEVKKRATILLLKRRMNRALRHINASKQQGS